ncbi:MAG: DUF2177 family protein [Woeseiaceae bacterium]|nr:DUF2177 family protein [Woeseiaceae bacterium]
MRYLKAAVATAIAFLVIDLAWITLFLGDVYEAQLGNMMREAPDALAAGAFYLGYIAGIVYLAIRPALQAGRVGPALTNGAVLGALAYGTYTLTNYAIFKQWSVTLVLSDIAWGTVLTASCAGVGYVAARK